MKRKLSYKTIGACLKRQAALLPEGIALVYQNKFMTWKELDHLSDGMAAVFHEMGIGSGTHAGIYCANCIAWIAVYMGLQKVGAITVLLNPGSCSSELEQILDYAKVEYLFYGESYKETSLEEVLHNALEGTEISLKKMCAMEKPDFLIEMKQAADVITQKQQVQLQEMLDRQNAKDIAAMLFTSGTTSSPKGVMLSHSNLVNCAIATAEAMHWKQTDKICVMVPLFHCFGMTSCMLASVVTGSTLCLLRQYRSKPALELIRQWGCTVLNGVPSMFLAMIQNKAFKEYDIHTLQSGIIAGSAVLPEDYERICEKLHIEHLQMSYGQTETSPGVTFSRYEEPVEEKCDNAGIQIPGIELCIWDKDGKQHIYSEEHSTEPGIEGELGVRGYIVMQYYFDKQEETAAALQKDGWLHTGDKCWMDEKKRLHVIGRMKEMIIRGGENINPMEIEACILGLPEVGEVKVVGIPHRILQEEIAAEVVLKRECTLSQEQIQDYVKQHLAHYKIPRYIRLVDRLPKSASGKVKNCEVKEHMEAFAQMDKTNKK